MRKTKSMKHNNFLIFSTRINVPYLRCYVEIILDFLSYYRNIVVLIVDFNTGEKSKKLSPLVLNCRPKCWHDLVPCQREREARDEEITSSIFPREELKNRFRSQKWWLFFLATLTKFSQIKNNFHKICVNIFRAFFT